MDTSDPDIQFDEKGVCMYCTAFIATNARRIASRTELPWIYHKMRNAGAGKKYDCLLGLSGGVDSSLCLHYLIENGIRPLCFSVDNGWNTPEADENIMRMVESLKVPFYRYTIGLANFRALQIAFIKSGTPNIEIPTDHILMATSYEMASKYGLKFIISGGNLSTEGIMPKAWGYNARDLRFIKAVYKSYMGNTTHLKDLPTLSLPQYLYQRFVRKCSIINLLDYYEYNRAQAKELLAQKYGWKDYGEKHAESIFTKWFQDCYLPKMFGIDKRKAHYSSLINSGQMTRAQAVELLKEIPACDWMPNLGLKEIKVDKIHSHRDYKNSEYAWDMLGKMYGIFKKQR